MGVDVERVSAAYRVLLSIRTPSRGFFGPSGAVEHLISNRPLAVIRREVEMKPGGAETAPRAV